MKTVKWLMGLVVTVLVAGTVWAGPGDGAGSGAEPRMAAGPEIPADLQTQLDSVLVTREALLSDLKALLEAHADATEEERTTLVEQWRIDNAAALEAQREAMQAVRQDIREWRLANRPQQSKVGTQAGSDNGQLSDTDSDALMARLKEQRQTRKQSMDQLRDELGNTVGAAQREQIIAQHREQRMEQMAQARDEVRTRRQQTTRDESVAALHERLQDEAQTLRSESRLRDREEATDRIAEERTDMTRDTLRDQVRDQDRDRLSE